MTSTELIQRMNNNDQALFSCLPECQLSELDSLEWLVIFSGVLFVYLVTARLRQIIFNSYANETDSIKWHVPRFLFVVMVVSIVSVPPVQGLLGSGVASLYIKTALPVLCIVVYLLWLLFTEEKKS